MKKPIEVRAYVRDSQVPVFFILVVGFASIAIFASSNRNFALAIFPLILAVIALNWVQASAKKKLLGCGASLSEEGISATLDGRATWTLPWNQFGGYRLLEVDDWARLRNPERCGIEVLNRQGIPVGTISIEPRNLYIKPRIAVGSRGIFWKYLNDRVPEGCPKHDFAQAPYRTTPLKVGTQACLAIGLFAVTVILAGADRNLRAAADQDATIAWNPFYGAFAGLAIPAAMAFLMISVKGISYLWFPRAYERLTRARNSEVITPLPAEGPRYYDFLVEQGGVPEPCELHEGTRYVQVGAEDRRSKLGESARTLKVMTAFIGALFLLVIGVGIFQTRQREMMATMAVMGLCVVVLLLFAVKSASRRVVAIDDTVVSLEGGLLVIHKDGSHISFSRAAKRRFLPPSSVGAHLKIEKWTEGRKSYLLDRTHLIKASVQLDHEELRELEHNFDTTS